MPKAIQNGDMPVGAAYERPVYVEVLMHRLLYDKYLHGVLCTCITFQEFVLKPLLVTNWSQAIGWIGKIIDWLQLMLLIRPFLVFFTMAVAWKF